MQLKRGSAVYSLIEFIHFFSIFPLTRSAVIETRKSSDLLKSLSGRSKPKDAYTPHGPPLRWSVIGDSYTAGPGAGDPFDNSRCYRTLGSYAAKLEQDFPWDTEQKLRFIACTGHKINDVIDQQVSELSNDKGTREDFVVMTVGGNDIEFSSLVRICALGIRLPFGRDCAEQLKVSNELLGSQDFHDKLWNLYDKIFEKLDLGHGEEYYQLYHLLYPVPIIEEDPHDGEWCNEKTFYDDCTAPPPTTGPKLTASLRYDLSSVTRKLNERIWKIAIKYIKDKGSNEYRGHLPGWGRNRLHVLEPIPGFIGHAFCEKTFNNFDDPDIYIQPYCDRAKGENMEQLTAMVDEFDLDADKCNSTSGYGDDEAYTYRCQVAMAKKYYPSQYPPSTRIPLPESWAKVFHPRPNGFEEYLDILRSSLLWNRPPMSQHADENCEAPKFVLPSESTKIDLTSRPEDFKLCPADPEESQPANQPEPSTPTRSLSIIAEHHYGIPELFKIHWTFFELEYGKTADCRSDHLLDETRDVDPTSQNLVYPGGTFDLKLSNGDCQYKNSGDNQGKLFCGDQAIECLDDPADKDPADNNADKGVYECPELNTYREPVFLCSW